MASTRSKIIVALIGSILLVVFAVAWFAENGVEPPEIEVDEKEYTLYDPSQITEDMVTPVYFTMAFTEEEKAELEEWGFSCVEIEKLGPGGSEGEVHWIGELIDRFWVCDREKEERDGNVIELLNKSGSFAWMEKGLDGRRLLSKPAKKYQVVIPRTGGLEWFYGYQMEEGNFADLDAQGFCHEYHYSPLKVYSSGGESNEGHIGGLVVYEGETVTFEVFQQVYSNSIHDCENEEILDWGGREQTYWLSVRLYPVLEAA